MPTADDEPEVLADVCRRTRAKLHAATVAVFAKTGNNSLAAAASDGSRIDPSIAARAVTAGVVIVPHQCEERIEAAAPVRYAGSVIGAVAARWALGSPESRAHAPGVLELTANRIAPALAVVCARRTTPLASDLLGVSTGERGSLERRSPGQRPRRFLC